LLSAAETYAQQELTCVSSKSVSAVALAALIVTPAAIALGFTDDSLDIPPAYVGQPYSKQFNGRGGCVPRFRTSTRSSAVHCRPASRSRSVASVATILGLTGGALPYRFVPMSGFPFGIGFDPNAGTIFGLPPQAGTLA
jgi:hypothetical protein